MEKMNDPSKLYVLFEDFKKPRITLLKKAALKVEHFDSFIYDRDYSQEMEVWVKK
jgi:hypothetical protein